MTVSVSPPLFTPTPRPTLHPGSGGIDFLPNLLITTLAAYATLQAMPVGAQSSQGIEPVTAYLTKTDPIQNLISSTLGTTAPAALPIGKQQSASAPPPKIQIQLDNFPNGLLRGIVAVQPFFQTGGAQAASIAAPSIAYQLRIDPIPNLLGKQLIQSTGLPFHPVDTTNRPEPPKSLTADMYVTAYVPYTVPTATVPPAIITAAPEIKHQVFVEPIQNTLIHGITAQSASIPIAKTPDLSQLQTKYDVYDLNSLWANSIYPENIPTPAPMPFIASLTYQSIYRTDVFDYNYLSDTGQLVRGIPPQITPIPPPIIQSLARPGGRVILNPKKLGETVVEPFNFISALGSGETIVSATCGCTVYTGADPNPSAMLVGAPAINGTIVQQEITGGILGCIYELLCTATTNAGEVIEISAYLAIEPDLPG